MSTKSGFSLVEILIAMTIVVLLGTVVGLKYKDVPNRANVTAAKMQIDAFAQALTLYIADNGFPPSEDQGLAALVECPTTDPVPPRYDPSGYIEAVPPDPWGEPYRYYSPGPDGEPFYIVSFGKDRKEGGTGFDADLTSSDNTAKKGNAP